MTAQLWTLLHSKYTDLFKYDLTPSSSHYISSIDGLRAIAVTLVLLFHGGFSWAKGGYVGVDVFFVISGFLITSQIFRDIEAKRWSFARFYTRRIARLLPAIFTVIVLTLVVAYFILTPTDLKRLSLSGFLAATFTSNIFFWTESGYFSQGAEVKPLLHTWSLGVEEQFYIFWPLILIALARWGRRAVIFGLLILALASISAALSLNARHPDAVFFLTPFRIFQFAFGGLIALGVTLPTSTRQSAIGLAGFAGLIMLTALISGEVSGPSGVWLGMVAPALSAAAFIYSSRTPLINTIFASPPMKWIGNRSYAIYLVHWPIMVLWNMATDFHMTPLEGVIAIFASVATGAMLYALVERPFRFSSVVSPRQAFSTGTYTISGFVICSALAVTISYNNGFPAQAAATVSTVAVNEQVELAEEPSNTAPRKKTCYMQAHNLTTDYDIATCASPPPDKASFFVLGDSLAGGLQAAIRKAYPDAYIGYFVVPGCSLLIPTSAPESSNHCQRHYDYAYHTILNQVKFDAVILTSLWSGVTNETIRDTVEFLRQHDIKPILTGNRPQFRERIPQILEVSTDLPSAIEKANSLLSPGVFKRDMAIKKEFSDDVFIVDYLGLFCPDNCFIVDEEGLPLYRDTHHLTEEGIRWFAEKLSHKYPDFIKDAIKL